MKISFYKSSTIPLFFYLFALTHITAAQNSCLPFIQVEHTNFSGEDKTLEGIKIFVIRSGDRKIPISLGKSSVPIVGIGLQFESKGREFYFPMSTDSLGEICLDFHFKYIYRTGDSLDIWNRTFLNLEIVNIGETFYLCNEKIKKGTTENLLSKSIFDTIQVGLTHRLLHKRAIDDLPEYFRDIGTYSMINFDKIGISYEEDFIVEVPNIVSFLSAEWGADNFAHRFLADPMKKEKYEPVLYISSDWNDKKRSLLCVGCSKVDSSYQNGKKIYFGVSDSGLYWKYFYHKGFGVSYVNVRKEDLDLFEYALTSFKVGNEIDRSQLEIKR